MISKVQPFNGSINFQSRIHMDYQTARFFESNSKESITGEFKHQLTKLKNNKEHDVVFLKRLDGVEEDGVLLEVVTKDGRHGESIIDNYTAPERKKIDIIGMYNEAKNSLKEKFSSLGFEALNI